MRIICTLDDFPECWVEVSEKWTRGEEKVLFAPTADQFMDLWGKKVVACNLRLESGEYITQPPAVTWDAMDGMDMRLAAFVGAVLSTAVLELRNLGKMSRRVSFNGHGAGNVA